MLAEQRAGKLRSLLSLTLSCTGTCWLYREQESLDLYFLSLSAVQEHAGCTESRRAGISTFSHSQLYRKTCWLYREQESWDLYFLSLSAVQEHAGCTESRRVWCFTYSHSQLYINMPAVKRAGELESLLLLTLSCTGRLYREQESWNLYFLSLSAVQEHAGCTESWRA